MVFPPAGTIAGQSQVTEHTMYYQKKCSKCPWVSLRSPDPRAYQGCIAEYEVHLKEALIEIKSAGEAAIRLKESEEYKLATQPRDVPASQDDANHCLSVVRFWRHPFNWRNCQLQIPLEQTPVCTVVDFEPLGLEVNNRGLLRDMHNRGCKSLKLKLFSDCNLKVIPAQQDTVVGFQRGPEGKLLTAKDWKELSCTKEAVKACHNYAEISRALHPLDSGPQILYKVVLEKFLAGAATYDQIIKFFSSVTWELANRASKSECPYKHDELCIKWDQLFRGSATSRPYTDSISLEKTIRENIKRELGQYVTSSPLKAKKQRANYTNWCPMFNTTGGCSNELSGDGCKGADGMVLKHGCNFREGRKMCNSKDHNRGGHTK